MPSSENERRVRRADLEIGLVQYGGRQPRPSQHGFRFGRQISIDGRRYAATEDAGQADLLDYFTYHAKGINHLLQSATHALKASMPEKTILASLLHDIANAIFIKSDHGYWGAH
jgi:hypothetical protein